jgi:NADPH:quinone reductase-like Zn-dependent oxidoreductase
VPRFVGLMLFSRFVPQLRGSDLPMPGKAEAIAALRGLLERGQITPIIDSTYPLSKVREAFRHMMEDETLGKVILTPRGSAGDEG